MSEKIDAIFARMAEKDEHNKLLSLIDSNTKAIASLIESITNNSNVSVSPQEKEADKIEINVSEPAQPIANSDDYPDNSDGYFVHSDDISVHSDDCLVHSDDIPVNSDDFLVNSKYI